MNLIPYEERLAKAIETGRQLKLYSGKGKEYYAIYVGYNTDAWLDFVFEKVGEFYPNHRKGQWVSTPGVIFKLHDQNPKMFERIGDTMFIHKRKFRKALRRALSKSFVKR